MIGVPRSILSPATLWISVLSLATLLAACSGDDNLLRLTDSDGYDGAPAWSPDGRKIAFVSDRDGDRDIYVMDADGSNVERLTEIYVITLPLPGG